MKKILLLTGILFFLNNAHANIPVDGPGVNANEVLIPLGESGISISLLELSQIHTRELELLLGKKMKFIEKLGFHSFQKHLRKMITADGTIKEKIFINKFMKKKEGHNGALGGFALGSLLGPIGLAIAYFLKDKNKKNRITWAWVGLLFFIPMWYLLFIIAVSISGGY